MAPLMQGEQGIGVLDRPDARSARRGFTEKEEALLRSFADQAVIAIQNAHLFNETQAALERQTATTEVLQVINASPGDLVPVFDAIVERASRLCEADYGALWLVSDGRARFSTGHSDAPPAYAEYLKGMPDSVGVSALLGRDAAPGGYLHVPDIREIAGYRERQPFVVAMVELGNSEPASTCRSSTRAGRWSASSRWSARQCARSPPPRSHSSSRSPPRP